MLSQVEYKILLMYELKLCKLPPDVMLIPSRRMSQDSKIQPSGKLPKLVLLEGSNLLPFACVICNVRTKRVSVNDTQNEGLLGTTNSNISFVYVIGKISSYSELSILRSEGSMLVKSK